MFYVGVLRCAQLISGGDLRCLASAESCGVLLVRSLEVSCKRLIRASSLRADLLLADQIRQGCPPLVRLRLQALFFWLVDHWLPIERFLPLISNARGIESTPALILACVPTCAFLFPRAAISNS